MLAEHSFYFHIMDHRGRGKAGIALEGIYMDSYPCRLPVVYTDHSGHAIIESFSNALIGLIVDGIEVEQRFYPGQRYGFEI